jgi:hypothetical protein
MSQEIIIGASPTGYQSQPRVDFDKTKFDKAIWDNGYTTIHERAFRCPCKTTLGGENRSNCLNCGGVGWVWVNPTRTRMLFEQQSIKDIYKEWALERLGDTNVSALPDSKLGYMDRLTISDGISFFTEIVHPKFTRPNTPTKMSGRLTYPPKEVDALFVFDDVDKKLIKLNEADYSFLGNIITILNDEINNREKIMISARYSHSPTYHVIKESRSNMVSRSNKGGNDVISRLPVLALARLAHYAFDSQNYYLDADTPTDLIDNSFTESKC